jgi:hypothetical protein
MFHFCSWPLTQNKRVPFILALRVVLWGRVVDIKTEEWRGQP